MAAHDTGQKLASLDALAANYGAAIPPDLKKMWLTLLGKYPAELVTGAVMRVIETYEYKTLPPFAVLKQALDDLTGTSDKALDTQALAEWGVFWSLLGQHAYMPAGMHPTTAYVVRLMGGWDAACAWPLKDMDFKRRDFVRLWVDAHGKVEQMQLGAGAVVRALEFRTGRDRTPLHIGPGLKAITEVLQ